MNVYDPDKIVKCIEKILKPYIYEKKNKLTYYRCTINKLNDAIMDCVSVIKKKVLERYDNTFPEVVNGKVRNYINSDNSVSLFENNTSIVYGFDYKSEDTVQIVVDYDQQK